MPHDRTAERAPLRAAATTLFLALDAAATLAGLHVATLLSRRSGLGDDVVALAWSAAPLLVLLRLAAVAALRLHRWSFPRAGNLGGARLALAMAGATAVFALVAPGLPPAVYVLEAFVTTAAMHLYRFGPAVCDDLQRALAASHASLRTVELPRRLLNVAVAAVGILITLPLWLAIAAAIKATSRGPVFYRQERIGLDLRRTSALAVDPRRKRDLGGRPFLMYKFRTMAVDAERETGAVWSTRDDPRVTPVGRFLRHSRLDELPQLLNVLKGDMNVVGPRPERATIFADLREKLPAYAARQRARPGITGYAQVNLEYDASVEDVAHKLEFDLSYVERQSFSVDLEIMAKTVPVMLFRDRMLGGEAGEHAPLGEKSGT